MCIINVLLYLHLETKDPAYVSSLEGKATSSSAGHQPG